MTEPSKGPKQVLMRSVIKSRRKNIGTKQEFTCNNPDQESFTLTIDELNQVENQQLKSSDDEVPSLLTDGDEPSSPTIPSDDHNNNLNSTSSKNQVLNSSAEETLPPTTGSNTNDAETHSNIIIPNPDLDDQLEFLKINEHRWDQGVLIFQVLYASSQGNVSLDVPFNTLKKDEPYKVARYI